MIKKDFWLNSKVAVIGGGSWGTVLTHQVSQNVSEVFLWVRSETRARNINSTRVNRDYFPELVLKENVKALSDIERVFENQVNLIVWALPSSVTRFMAKKMAPFLTGDEIVIHVSKGVEIESLKRVSQVLEEELPVKRIGVLSGPNLAKEMAQAEPAATVVASLFPEVVVAGQQVFTSDKFRVYPGTDIVGVEWAGALKNVLAIAAGCLDALGLGWNARSLLLSRGLVEMVRFGVEMGARQETFLGLAGMGDLLATCSSPLSRNFRVGKQLAEGKKIDDIIQELGSTAEGVRTTQIVHDFALRRNIEMPITTGVYELIRGKMNANEVLGSLMKSPLSTDLFC